LFNRDYQEQHVNKDFVLWLVSHPSEKFPVEALQQSVKIAHEPPQGIKANFRALYCEMEEEYEAQDKKVKRLLFQLALFHSVIVERKKFGPQGWVNSIGWTTGDFLISKQQILGPLKRRSSWGSETRTTARCSS